MKFIKTNGKLAFYNKKADSTYWDQHWENFKLKEFLSSYENGRLDDFEKMFLKHLPKDQKILEAGCGMGRYVIALRARNYDAIGIDYAKETIKKIQEIGYLYINYGNVFSLEND
ncbi:MAG: hypothetical protein HY934_01925, partial [Candidatus Firestonebacteria bacterium]|nr:hypothetical protein [Candidatus Firestonebacteria bacterium]